MLVMRIILLISVSLQIETVYAQLGGVHQRGSDEWHLIDVDRLDLKYMKFRDNRDPMTPQYTSDAYDYRAALQFDVSLLKYGTWENDVHMETLDSGEVKTVGWHWIAGVRAGRYLDLIYEHHSRHVMDEDQQSRQQDRNNKFPVEDSYGIRIHLLGK